MANVPEVKKEVEGTENVCFVQSGIMPLDTNNFNYGGVQIKTENTDVATFSNALSGNPCGSNVVVPGIFTFCWGKLS